jgi:hypothetical protein
MRKMTLREVVPELDYSELYGTLLHEIEVTSDGKSLTGGWVGGLAIASRWNPDRPTNWHCWAQTGPIWGDHCGAEVKTEDELGLCDRHRHALVGPREKTETISLGSMAIEHAT